MLFLDKLIQAEYHGATFIDYEAESFTREKENEEKMRQKKKRRGRGM